MFSWPPTCEQHQPEAPVGVPERAASQQDFLIVQRVFLPGEAQRSGEAVEPVVGSFTAHLTLRGDRRAWRLSSKSEIRCIKALLHLHPLPASCLAPVLPLKSTSLSTSSPRSPVTGSACFTFRLVSLRRRRRRG